MRTREQQVLVVLLSTACLLRATSVWALQAAVPPPAESHTGRDNEQREVAGKLRFAVRASKILTAAHPGAETPAVINDGVLIIEDGHIASVASMADLELSGDWVGSEDLDVIDVRPGWLVPGFIDLHNHIAYDTGDSLGNAWAVNDTVYLANPGLRASANVELDNALQRRGVAGGVTTVLYIPGSGSNMGGQGVLLKLGVEEWERKIVRAPGSLKIAQAGNPEGWTVGVGNAFMNWNTRKTIERGRNYHAQWEAWEEGRGERPRRDIQWDVFRELFAHRTQVSTHTQLYSVVLATITMLREELGLDVYIDHGSYDGYRTAPHAEQSGVAAILGPRMISVPYQGFVDQDGAIVGMAAEFQARGHNRIGFNTDCVGSAEGMTPPQEELSLQAAMALRYGMSNDNQEGLRGLTTAPAEACGLAAKIGSLEPGKEADFLVIGGDPADPRTSVDQVYTGGGLTYDAAADGKRW